MMKLRQTTAIALLASVVGLSAVAAEPDPQLQRRLNGPAALDSAEGAPPALSDFEVRTSRGHFFKRAITSRVPRTTASADFQPLEGARTTILIPPRSSVLVNASFDAETRCSDFNSAAGFGWCEVRININGVEGEPAASFDLGDTFALDSTDGGTEGDGSWEGHAVSRHQCISNESTRPREVEVSLDWKVTNFPAASFPSFWIDDYSFIVEMSRGCQVERFNGGVGTSVAAPIGLDS